MNSGLLAGAALLAALGIFTLTSDKDSVSAAGAVEGTYGTNTERTFIAVKPDGVQRGLVGEIIKRFEARGYKLVAIKALQPTEAFAKQHYADLSQKPFFPSLVKYFSSGPVVAMVWEGKGVIAGGRSLIGATNPAQALPGSIRGDLCIETGRNIIHGSDGKDSAKDEITLWFKPTEVVEYNFSHNAWVHEKP
jgi:nucleoside-diphosphate kinase